MGLGAWLGRVLGLGGGTAGPIADTPFVVLDTELTGLDERKDDIVSIGAVRMRGGRLELGGSFHELVNPKAALQARSVVIHGITPSQVAARPPIEEVLAAFLAYAGDAVLVGHCLPVDLAFLNREARRVAGGPLRNRTVDTLSLSAWLRQRHVEHPAFAGPPQGLGLFELARAFDIPVVEGHTALGDAYLTAQLLQRLLPLAAQAGVTDLASLLRVGDPTRQAEHLAPPGGPSPF
ncbi:DNA polymerase III subunit epsilon [Geothrix rubra]|uniref:DNA polymerase III subunit epsilon n=1 Tax=Geothrix rubra TaxID=2927977 RepID=A0ABQ5Q8T3_9BACT|nr:3'-5' exonuclease [Geothrix rubra]GLH70815.1 DNA polymerase III subunit epsilon [Geothrix rubra]